MHYICIVQLAKSPAIMATFSVTVKRITDLNCPMIQEMIRLDGLKGKKRLPYTPLPDAQETFPFEGADRREAYKAGIRFNGLEFTGQKREIWIDGTQEFGNF